MSSYHFDDKKNVSSVIKKSQFISGRLIRFVSLLSIQQFQTVPVALRTFKGPCLKRLKQMDLDMFGGGRLPQFAPSLLKSALRVARIRQPNKKLISIETVHLTTSNYILKV